MPFQPDPLISSLNVARLLGLQPQTLRAWRLRGKGPKYIRLGDNSRSRVAYRQSDILAWQDERRFAHTAEETNAGLNRLT